MTWLEYLATAAIVGSIAGLVLLALGLIERRKRGP